jgi:hypothetical protein
LPGRESQMVCAGAAEVTGGAVGANAGTAAMAIVPRAPATSYPTSTTSNNSPSLSFCTRTRLIVFLQVRRQQDGSEAPEFPRIIEWLLL